MKHWLIFMLVAPVFLSAASSGDISFDSRPYVHPNSFDFEVDYDNSHPDGYILEISQDARTINPMRQNFTSPAGISCDLRTSDVFVTEYISPGNYQAGEVSSLTDYFKLKKSVKRYGWDGSLVYDSNRENFYVNEYKGDTLNRCSIDGFDGHIYKKSYGLNLLISEIYIVILIGLLVFLVIRVKMRFRSV